MAGQSSIVGGTAGALSSGSAPAHARSPFTSQLTEDEVSQLSTLQSADAKKDEPNAAMEAVLGVLSLHETSTQAPTEDEDESVEVDLTDLHLRTERLKGITLALDRSWWSGQEYVANAAEKLANGSRDVRWRIPIGDSGLLDAFLMIIDEGEIHSHLRVHALRLIGNACADSNENRARVVSKGSLRSVIALLEDKDLIPFVIPVLFNVCFDYEPAQKQASEMRLSTALVPLISDAAFRRYWQFLGYACKLFDMIAAQPDEVTLAPDNTVDVLLELAVSPASPPNDLEDFVSLVNAAMKYLQHERFQVLVCKTKGLDNALQALLISYTQYDNGTAQVVNMPGPDEDEAKQLLSMRNEMNQILSDVSALPEFATRCPVNSAMSSFLQEWLSSSQSQLQVCACIMLGNLARSDKVCEEFVHSSRIHHPLMQILNTRRESQVLYAALGFLKNLALPSKNKVELGDAGIIELLPKLWAMDPLPQIQYSSISLARQLLIGNHANVRRINAPLSTDPGTPPDSKSRLSVLISLFSRTDAEPVRMEISRTIAAVCRVLAAGSPSADLPSERKNFFEHHRDIGLPLSFMVSQTKWPAIRSEGWFVLALVARTEEGVQCVADIVQESAVFSPLLELMTGNKLAEGTEGAANAPTSADLLAEIVASNEGKPSPTQAVAKRSAKEEEGLRHDRENALVLVNELLRQRGSTMSAERRAVFEKLLEGGGKFHVSSVEGQDGKRSLPAPA